MTYPYDSFYMLMDAGSALNGNVTDNYSSRTQPKRGIEWITGAIGQGTFSNKKQTIDDVVNVPSAPGVFPKVVSPWNDYKSGDPLNPGHIDYRQLSVNVQENVASFGRADDMNGESNSLRGQTSEHNSAGTLLVSHGKENPSLGCIEDSQGRPVRDSYSSKSLAFGSSLLMGGYEYHSHKIDSLPLVPVFGNSFDSNIGDDFALPGESFMRSMVVTFNQEYGDLIHQRYDRADEHVIPFGLPNRNNNFMLHYENVDSGMYRSVVDPSYERELNTLTLMGYSLGREIGSALPMASSYPEGNNALIPMLESYDEKNSNLTDDGVNNSICYGGFHERPAMNTSVGYISSYAIVNEEQNPFQASTVSVHKDAASSGAYPIATGAPINPETDKTKTLKKRIPKKADDLASNYFPANVKSLLSTGIFDGVPVKYVSWSRDKCLRGIINGTGYLCSCKECNNLRVINAYEFEQHAGCKTKHPNNHIYFESGRTIYAVVLELRKTPRGMLLEKIQMAAGSPVNEKNFLAWKVSFEAVADEFEQIYGEKEAGKSSGGVEPAARSG